MNYKWGLHYTMFSDRLPKLLKINRKLDVKKHVIQGSGWCQNYLGLMYEKGRGVSRDITKAYMWFNLADYNGDFSASGNKIRLTKGESIFKMPFEAMTISDISKAQLMSSRCLESNYTDC
jgi:TPR repeat protein